MQTLNRVLCSLLIFAIVASPAICQPSKNTDKKTSSTKQEKTLEQGERLFATHCASCHESGGNSIKPSKPVKGSPVLATIATFKAYLDKPVGDMPHYEHLIRDDKLLTDLRAYAKSLDTQASDKETKKPSSPKEKKSNDSKAK